MSLHRFGTRIGGGRERVILLCDTSSSMANRDYHPNRLAACQEAFKALLTLKVEHSPDDEVGIVTFDSSAKLVCSPVPAAEGEQTLRGKIDTLHASGCTDMEAGIRRATRALAMKKGGKTGVGRLFSGLLHERPSETPGAFVPRIICCTDGAFNSREEARRAAEHTRDQGIVVDVIGVAGSRSSSGFHEEHCLEIASDDLTAECGKRYAFVTDTQQLIHEFKARANLIRRM